MAAPMKRVPPTLLACLREPKTRQKKQPAAAPAKIEPPTWLSEKALLEWHRLSPVLMERNSLRSDSQQMIATYCECFSDLQNAQTEFGTLTHAADRQRAWRRVVDSRSHLLRYGIELGLLPGKKGFQPPPVVHDDIDPRIFG